MSDRRCRECGRSMPENSLNPYCSDGCRDKAWRREHTFNCKTCGKEYIADTGIFGPKAHGYCSEECQRRGLLKRIKPKAEKMLKALKKSAEKQQALIDNLSTALRGDDPKVIAKAIRKVKGGLFKRLWRALKAIVFIVVAIVIIIWAVGIYLAVSDNNGDKRDAGRTEKPAEVVNELPPLEEAQAEPKATSAEVVAPSSEEGETTTVK